MLPLIMTSAFIVVLLSSMMGMSFAEPSLWDSYQLTTFGSQPDWSPDGKQLVFVSYSTYGPNTSEIWEINIDGSNPQLVKASDNIGASHPKYSPDGKHIAFIGDNESGDAASIFIMNADGSDMKKYVTDNQISTFTWTSDGNIIYIQYATTAENAVHIKRLLISGSMENRTSLVKTVSLNDTGTNATTFGVAGNVAVSRNDTRLLFTAYLGSDSEIYSLDLSNGDLQKIGGLDGFNFVALSADNHTIFVGKSGSFASPSITLYSTDLRNTDEKVELSTSGNFDYTVHEKLKNNATIAANQGNSIDPYEPLVAYAFADAYPSSFDKDLWGKFGIYVACQDQCEPKPSKVFSDGYTIDNDGKYVKGENAITTLATSTFSITASGIVAAGIVIAIVIFLKRRKKRGWD